MHHQTALRMLRLLACLALAALIAPGCASPSYYTQAVSGHLELMRLREPVEDVLASPETGEELKAKLELAAEVRAFGVESLGLPGNETYTQFARTGREAVSWNVVAAPEFSLEPKTWCFLVAGCVPYRGYFEQDAARRFAGKLQQKGYDVSVTPALAYSTLGWFEDPLLDTMLARSDAELAAVLFHEMAHQYLYVKGDTLFNESFASFVEEAGVTMWLESRDADASLQAWKDGRQAARQFQVLLESYRAELDTLYAAEQPPAEIRAGKERLYAELEKDWAQLSRDEWNGVKYFGSWFEQSPNNARLALLQSYRGGTCAFDRLFRESGRDMPRFLVLAEDKSRLAKTQRAEWLQQPCNPIAPDGNL